MEQKSRKVCPFLIKLEGQMNDLILLREDLERFIVSAENNQDKETVNEYIQDLKIMILKHLECSGVRVYEKLR